MEASFCGSDVGVSKGFHFTTLHLEHMGQVFGRTLYDYFYTQESPNISSSSASVSESAMPKPTYQLDMSNPIISHAFLNLKREISNGNTDFLESFGSSDSDTSSDEEELRILPKIKKTRSKSQSLKTNQVQTIVPTPSVKSPPNTREIKQASPVQRANSNKFKLAPKPKRDSIKKQNHIMPSVTFLNLQIGITFTPRSPYRHIIKSYSGIF